MTRIIINVKDIRDLMGTGDKAARRLMGKLRTHANKERGVPITVYDFSEYVKMDVEEVIRIVNRR